MGQVKVRVTAHLSIKNLKAHLVHAFHLSAKETQRMTAPKAIHLALADVGRAPSLLSCMSNYLAKLGGGRTLGGSIGMVRGHSGLSK